MINRYPFLAFWKKRGLNKIPSIPPEKLLEILTEPFLKKQREAHKERFYKFPTISVMKELQKEDAQKIEEIEFKELIKPNIERAVLNRFLDLLLGELTANDRLEARRRIVLNGETKEQVIADFKKTLPDAQGGSTLQTRGEEISIMAVYLELKEYIKEIERTFGKGEYDDADEDILSETKKKFPEINSIFTDEEILFLRKGPTTKPAKAAREIIARRLAKSPNIRHRISARTLKDILSKIYPKKT